jgi:hypothetical protein
MQHTHVLRRSTPPTAVLLVCFVSVTSIGVAVGDLEHALGCANRRPAVPSQVPVVTMAA